MPRPQIGIILTGNAEPKREQAADLLPYIFCYIMFRRWASFRSVAISASVMSLTMWIS